MTVEEFVKMRDDMEQEMLQKGRELEDAIYDFINIRTIFKIRESTDRVTEALAAYTDASNAFIDFENQSFDN